MGLGTLQKGREEEINLDQHCRQCMGVGYMCSGGGLVGKVVAVTSRWLGQALGWAGSFSGVVEQWSTCMV